jgi:hypothetical protein
MIHIPLHKATLESILETLNLNADSFDASAIDSSDLLALTNASSRILMKSTVTLRSSP